MLKQYRRVLSIIRQIQLLIMAASVNEKKNVRSHYLTISSYLNNPSYVNSSCDTQVTGFHNLPDNILLSIFKYFNEIELRKNIIPVCRHWRQTAFTPVLWRSLEFKGSKVPEDFIFQQLRVLPNLERISLINIVNAEIAIRQLCRCNKELKMITIKNCKYTNHIDGKFPERVLRNLVICCKKLEKINLKGTPFKARHFYMNAAALPNLRSINLGNNPFLRTKNLYELILNCHNLEELKLSYRSTEQQLTDTDVVCLFAKLRPTLKSITFDMAELSDTSLAAILECNHLEKLNLYNTSNLSSELFVMLWHMLRNLKILKIQNSMISNEHFVRLFTDGRATLCNLKLLNLSGSKLNSKTLETISECCRNLEKIVLKCCKNLERLEIFLENCPHLTSINVAFCGKIADNELGKIAEKLLKLKTIYLDFHRRDVLENVKKTYPHLNIFVCLSEFSKSMEKLE